MGIFSRGKRVGGAKEESGRGAQAETMAHMREFVDAHEGCEAFIEPATRVTQTTLVIVAGTGEWTRRRVPDPKAARALAKDLKIIAYDVNLSGYPSRMREWNEKKRKSQG